MTEIIVINEVLEEEPGDVVSLAEIKRHLQIEDISDGSTDTLLDSMRSAAIQAVEGFTGCSLQKKTITVNYRSKTTDEYEELRRGPLNEDDPTLDGITATMVGAGFKYFSGTSTTPFTISYKAGYEYGSVPAELKAAVLKHVADQYFQRNDTGDGWKKDAKPFRRPHIVL